VAAHQTDGMIARFITSSPAAMTRLVPDDFADEELPASSIDQFSTGAFP